MDSSALPPKHSPWRRLKDHFSEAFSEQFRYVGQSPDATHAERQSTRRQRDAYRYILMLLALVLVPIDIHNLYTGQLQPAIAGLLLLGIIGGDIWRLGTGRRPLLSPLLLMLLSIALILFSVFLGQDYSLYWLYPLLVALPVILLPQQAVVLGALAGLVVTPLVFAHFELGAAIVLSCSMLFTWVVSAWLVFAVTEQSRRLRSMAVTDPLTGAYNRRYLEEQARHALNTWDRYRQPAVLLILDIDHFKRINDHFGHAGGDDALKKLVEVISGRLRRVDIFCRFGGEEFVVLLPGTTPESALILAEDLRARVENAYMLPEGRMTISIGLSDVAAARSLDQWLNLADTALYLAKRGGRNRVEIAQVVAPDRSPIPHTVPDWR